jgi:hypothetical protein
LQVKPMITGSKVAAGAAPSTGPVRQVPARSCSHRLLDFVVVGHRVRRPLGRRPVGSDLSRPSICARTCSSLKPVPEIAPAGQAATQVPQPWHMAALMLETPLTSSKLMAL